MMNNIKFFLAIIFILPIFLIQGCSKDESIILLESDYFIFGTFYGECIGEGCVEIYKIDNDMLYEDIEDMYPNGGSQETGNYQALSDEKFMEVNEIVSNIPETIWRIDEGTIGCPDCTDGGGVYIEIKKEGTTKVWLIDNFKNNVPETLHDVITKVHNAVDVLQ